MIVLDAVRTALTDRVAVQTSGAGEVVLLPLFYSTGNQVRVWVERLADDEWLVSDRGVAAGELAIADVDLEAGRPVVLNSWARVAASTRLPLASLRDGVEAFDLAGVVDAEHLGRAVLDVAEASMRGEMLRVLAPGYRARGFREEVIARAGERHPIVPNAPMPTKHGGRRSITVRVDGENGRTVYVQAVSGKSSALDGFDKAQAVFSSAAVESGQLVAVLADPVKLETWQWQTLEESGRPVHQRDFDALLSELVPA